MHINLHPFLKLEMQQIFTSPYIEFSNTYYNVFLPSGYYQANPIRKNAFNLMMRQSAPSLKEVKPENEKIIASSENMDDYNFDHEDIGTSDNTPGPENLSKCPYQPPTQPVKHQYPGIGMRKKIRRF